MRRDLLIAAGMSFLVSMAFVTVSRAESGACCHGDVCLDVADAFDCQVYTCDVAALLPVTFGGCYGDADGNGFVNAGDRGFIAANIGLDAPELVCLYDMDGNGEINPGDRGFVAANIGLCSPLPDWQNGSGLNGGDPDSRFPAAVFSAGLTCDQDHCPIPACDNFEWTGGFHLPGLDYQASVLAVFDDGTGPALYTSGSFTAAGGVAANRIAKWDGAQWSPLAGPSGNGLSGNGTNVLALAVFDDGTGAALYAGGDFTGAGGVAANYVAKWDGTYWSALSGPNGNGMNDQVMALTVFDDGAGPALYAGGSFTTAGGGVANYIAKWDGTQWSALSGANGNGMAGNTSPHVYALTVFDDGTGPALYAGGSFTTAGGVAANGIAKWNGVQWSALTDPSGNGMNGTVRALSVFDDGTGPALYAGGSFITAGGVTANGIAKWDGTQWSALAGPIAHGTNGTVLALAVHDDGTGPALYAGGGFTTAGGAAAFNIAKWNGTQWSALAGPNGNGPNSTIRALTVFDHGSGPALYAAGGFISAGGVTVRYIATWDGARWSAVPDGNGINDTVRALTVFDDGAGPELYAGGYFTSTGAIPANRVAKWNGTQWSALTGLSRNAFTDQVYALTAFDDGTGHALYAGGRFTTPGEDPAYNVAKWDGAHWSPLAVPSGMGMNGTVYALMVFDDGTGPALYAGGSFDSAGGVTAGHIAKWDGTQWSALTGPNGNGLSFYVSALIVFDDGTGRALYAGGAFTTAGGVIAHNIAKWDGTAWSALAGPSGIGMSSWVDALSVFDDGTGPALYAAGNFIMVGGVAAAHVAKWDGTQWSALTGPDGNGMNSVVNALTVFDDGTGPALYAGGAFNTAGGVTAYKIAKWDGTQWSPLVGLSGAWIDGSVYALTAFDNGTGPALYAGGYFTTAGGIASSRIARWGCAP